MLHVYQDNLWALGDQSLQMPVILAPTTGERTKLEENRSADADGLESSSEQTAPENKLEDLSEKIEQINLNEEEKIQTVEIVESLDRSKADSVDHEQILTDSFLIATKYKSKELKLPVIVSTFMKLMQNCW